MYNVMYRFVCWKIFKFTIAADSKHFLFMASVTVNLEVCGSAGGGALNLDSIPVVDLRLFSGSELYSLSQCSSSVFDLSRCDEDVIPKIDRSVFNESAGSRKQTYFRLRLAPPLSLESRRRDPQLSLASSSDTEDAENMQIVNILKQLFVEDKNLAELAPVKGDNTGGKCPDQFLPLPPSALSNSNTTENTRKRSSSSWIDKSRNEEENSSPCISSGVDLDKNVSGLASVFDISVRKSMEDSDRLILNTDGAAVDLVALGSVEHPYTEEIKRRTRGLRSNEEFVGFLEGLNGHWRSRSKRKKIVDACLFGSVLPVGWKIMLSIKKKNGQMQLSCRRYISPGGVYFVTCRGVSSYLCSLHGIQCAHSSYYVHCNEMVNDADMLKSATIADPPIEINSRDVNLASEMPLSAGSVEGEMKRAREILYCSNCDGTFSSEEDISRHYAAAHKRKRYKNGVHESDDVIIEDEKYECLLCHKVFNERDQYTAHVDAHVSSQAKTTGDSLANGIGSFCNLNSSSQFSVKDHLDGKSLISDGISTIDKISNNQLPVCSPCYKQDEHAGALTDENVSKRHDHEANAANSSSVADALHSMRMNLLQYDCQNISSGKTVDHDKISLNRSPGLSEDETNGVALFCVDGESGTFEKFLHSKMDEEECGSVSQQKHVNNSVQIKDLTVKIMQQKQKSYESVEGTDKVNKMHFADGSFVLASNEHKNMPQTDESAAVIGQLEQSKKRDTSESRLGVMSSHQSMYSSEYGNLEVCRKDMKVAESNEFEYSGTGQPNDDFESCHGVLHSTRVPKADHDRKYEVCSTFTSDKMFAEENMNIVFNDDLEGHREGHSDGVLFASGIPNEGCVFDTVYGQQQHEIQNRRRIPDQSQSLSFGDLQTKLCSDSNRIKQGSYREGGFTTQTPAHRTYVNQASSSTIDGSIPEDLKLGMSYAFGFTDPSFNNRSHESVNNFDISQRERVWNGQRGDKIQTYGQNLNVGNCSQFVEQMNTDVPWRTRPENDLRGCFRVTPAHRITPSNHFHNFGIAMDQGTRDDEMRRVGNTQPVEYSFMGEHQTLAREQQHNNMLSYKRDSEPRPAFWLGKSNAPTTTTTRGMEMGMGMGMGMAGAASVCIWCRNMFFHEVHAIGTICPSCRSRFPGQFNLL